MYTWIMDRTAISNNTFIIRIQCYDLGHWHRSIKRAIGLILWGHSIRVWLIGVKVFGDHSRTLISRPRQRLDKMPAYLPWV